MGDDLGGSTVTSPFGADDLVLGDESLGPAATQTLTRTGPVASTGWGTPGEQTMAFELGKRDYDILTGPGGAAGKNPSANGWDAVAVHRHTDELLIVENKASGLTGLVQDATSLTRAWQNNLTRAITEIQDLPDSEVKTRALTKLQALKHAGETHGTMPQGVRVVITNAGG